MQVTAIRQDVDGAVDILDVDVKSVFDDSCECLAS